MTAHFQLLGTCGGPGLENCPPRATECPVSACSPTVMAVGGNSAPEDTQWLVPGGILGGGRDEEKGLKGSPVCAGPWDWNRPHRSSRAGACEGPAWRPTPSLCLTPRGPWDCWLCLSPHFRGTVRSCWFPRRTCVNCSERNCVLNKNVPEEPLTSSIQ